MNKHYFKYSILLIAIILLIFSPCLKLGFVNFDDEAHLIENAATRSLDLSNLKAIFTQRVQKVYIPLTTLSFAIERSLFGLNPFVYHLDNLLLHIANSVIILFIALRLNIPIMGAFFGSAIFALHPMRVESVAWVTERKDVLCALFYLLALWQWIIYRQRSRRGAFVWAHIFTLLSLLAKPMAISLPFAFLCVDWLLGCRISFSSIKEKTGIFILSALVGWITYQEHVRNPIDNIATGIQSWVSGLGFYWQKFFLPLNLIPIYPIPIGKDLLFRFCLSSLLIIAILWLVFKNRRDRLFMFALLFYVATIFFLLRFDTRADIHWVADRFMYIPSIGLCLWLGSYLNSHRKIAVITVFILSVLTWSLIPAWKDSLSLWTYVIRKSPNEMMAYFNRAGTYQDQGQYDKAVADYNKTLDLLKALPSRQVISVMDDEHHHVQSQIKPWHLNATEIKYNRAIALVRLKKADDAILDLNEVIEYYPQYDKAYLQRGLAYDVKGNKELAIADLSKCGELNIANAECLSARGTIYNKLGRWFDALADYNRAIAINPQDARVYNNRAVVYMALELPQKAFEDFNHSIRIDKNYGEAIFNRSVYNFNQHQFHEALVDMVQASNLGVLIPDKFYQELMRLNHLSEKK